MHEQQQAALLSDNGLRPTPQRLAVLSALLEERDDATAQQIHGALRQSGHRIGLATVYRALAALARRGVVDELNHRPREACYRLCTEGHHHHLVCSECHRVVELGDCELDAWLAPLAAEHSFTVSGHTIEVTGICAECRDREARL